MKLFNAHLKAPTEQQKLQHAQAQHEMDVSKAALGGSLPRRAMKPKRKRRPATRISMMSGENKLEQAATKAV